MGSLKNYTFDCNDNCIDNAEKKLRLNGFVLLKNFFSKEFVINLYTKTIHAYENKKITNKLRDIHKFSDGTLSSIHNISDYLPFYKKVINQKNVKLLSKNYFKTGFEFKLNSSYFAKPPNKGLETKPHQDNAFFCMNPAEVLTFWFPIEYSGSHNGPLYYYPKTNKKNYIHRPLGNLGTSMAINSNALNQIKIDTKKIYIEANIGDCVIHDGLVVHGSDKNKSIVSRKAFNFSLFGNNSLQNKELFKKYKNNLKKYLKNKKIPN